MARQHPVLSDARSFPQFHPPRAPVFHSPVVGRIDKEEARVLERRTPAALARWPISVVVLYDAMQPRCGCPFFLFVYLTFFLRFPFGPVCFILIHIFKLSLFHLYRWP